MRSRRGAMMINDHSQQFEEITNWVLSHRSTRPEVLLSALVGNAIALARSLGISRAGFMATAQESWDDTERRAAVRKGAS